MMTLNVWTEAELQETEDQLNAGEPFTEEQLVNNMYQFFKRQDNNDLTILKTLYADTIKTMIGPRPKQWTFDAYAQRYQEISCTSFS